MKRFIVSDDADLRGIVQIGIGNGGRVRSTGPNPEQSVSSPFVISLEGFALYELTLQETNAVSGSWSLLNFLIGQGVSYALDMALSGRVDDSMVAESQDHYYNMVGA